MVTSAWQKLSKGVCHVCNIIWEDVRSMIVWDSIFFRGKLFENAAIRQIFGDRAIYRCLKASLQYLEILNHFLCFRKF